VYKGKLNPGIPKNQPDDGEESQLLIELNLAGQQIITLRRHTQRGTGRQNDYESS
jgi:hypothetical protein